MNLHLIGNRGVTGPYEPDPFLASLIKHMMAAIETPGVTCAQEVFTVKVPLEWFEEFERANVENILL